MENKELYEEDQIKQAAYEEDREYESCECEQEELEPSVDERFVELEIAKEQLRIDKEIWFEGEEKQDFVDTDEFSEGLREGAFIGGFVTALINSGISVDKAFELAINAQTCKHNLKLSEMNNKTNIEISKIQAVQIDKQSI